jgi:hypothetical protein
MQIDGLRSRAGRRRRSRCSPRVVSRGGTEEPVTADGQPRGSVNVDRRRQQWRMATDSIRANAPPDAIQEFRVLTTQCAAEFGNASG